MKKDNAFVAALILFTVTFALGILIGGQLERIEACTCTPDDSCKRHAIIQEKSQKQTGWKSTIKTNG